MTTTNKRLNELVERLQAQANQLLAAEIWDDRKIILNAQLSLTFKEVIGSSDQSISDYLSAKWGCCKFTEEELNSGYPFKADKWDEDDLPSGFYDDYLTNIADIEGYLPAGFIKLPFYEYEREYDFTYQKPATGEVAAQILEDYGDLNYEELLPNLTEPLDKTDIKRRLAIDSIRHDLVMTGYLTNQQNIMEGQAMADEAYRNFRKELKQELEDIGLLCP